MRSYAVRTDDGKAFRRDRGLIKRCYRPPATSMPEVESEHTNMTAMSTLFIEKVKDLGQTHTPPPEQVTKDTPPMSPNVLPPVKDPPVGEGTVTRSSRQIKLSTRFNPLRPNNDLSQTSRYNIKALPVSEVMRIENMITQVKFY